MDSVAGAAGGPSPSIQTLDIESSTSQLRLDGPAEAPPQVLDLNSPTLEIPRELPSRQGTSTPRTMSSVSDERQRAADILKLLRGFCSLGVNTEQDFEALGKTVLRDCRRFFGCDRASLLIANFAEGLFKPMWWDWESLDNPYIQRLHEVEISQFALPLGKGIAGDSFAKQQVVIVDDAQTDPRFFKEVDEVFQYRIRSIMSVPLKKVAVLNLYNKTGPAEEIFTFNQDDIDTAVALADMLSVVLEKALLQREVRESEQRLKVTWDILSYRLGVTDGMVSDFLVRWDSYLKMDPHPIDAYDWDSQHMADDECVAAFVAMMYRLGYVETFKLDRAKLVRYGLTVAGNYRQKDHVAYHNLGHATAVTHGMYKLLRRYGAKKLFGEDDIETMALVLACFCHDLDHRGLSNQYLKSQNSFLAEIAHSSVMEEHHSNFAVSILTAPECNILENLPAEDFKHVLHMMRANIVSTDLAVYFSRKQKLTELITSGQLDISDKPQRRMIRGLLMNVCDLMAMTLPFRQSMRVVDCVMEEFFCQGDREKAQGLPPSSELMDRDKMSSIPRMQIGFLNNVFMPIYNLVSAPNVLPRTAELVGLAKRTISKWERWVSLGAGYSMGCEVPWSAEEEEEEEKLEAEQIRAHWQRMDEEDLRERKEEEQRQFMAAQVRRQSIAAVNIDALRRTSVKAMPTLGRPGGRKSSGGSDKMLGADLVPLVTKLP